MTVSVLPRVSPDHALVVRRVAAEDRALLTGLLAAASPDSLYQRFLTGAVAPLPARLVTHLLAVGTGGSASFACLGGEVVGHGMWVPAFPADGRTAEIALLVRDDHQRRGIGTALMDVLRAELGAAGYDVVQMTTLAANQAVSRMVRRLQPDAEPERDGAEVTYWLRVGGGTLQPAQPVQRVQPVRPVRPAPACA